MLEDGKEEEPIPLSKDSGETARRLILVIEISTKDLRKEPARCRSSKMCRVERSNLWGLVMLSPTDEIGDSDKGKGGSVRCETYVAITRKMAVNNTAKDEKMVMFIQMWLYLKMMSNHRSLQRGQ